MNEPITVASARLTDALCEAIRESCVPAFICRYILKDIDTELERIAKEQLRQDMAVLDAQKEPEEPTEPEEVNDGDAQEVPND